MEERREGLPGGSETVTSQGMKQTPGSGEGGPGGIGQEHGMTGGRAATAVGSVVIFHNRVEEPYVNDGPPLGHLHGEVKALPKDQ